MTGKREEFLKQIESERKQAEVEEAEERRKAEVISRNPESLVEIENWVKERIEKFRAKLEGRSTTSVDNTSADIASVEVKEMKGKNCIVKIVYIEKDSYKFAIQTYNEFLRQINNWRFYGQRGGQK